MNVLIPDDMRIEELSKVQIYKIEDLKSYMKVPVSKKLDFLAEMNEFLNSFMSEESKKFRDKLREEGW